MNKKKAKKWKKKPKNGKKKPKMKKKSKKKMLCVLEGRKKLLFLEIKKTIKFL